MIQRIEIARLFVEHLAVVVVAAGGGVSVERFGRVIVVEVAQGNDLLLLAPFQVIAAHAADSHRGDGQRVAGSLVAAASQHMTRKNQRSQAGGHHGSPRDGFS